MQKTTLISKQWKLYFLMMLLLPFVPVAAQSGSFPLDEDFEGAAFPPSGWSVYDIDGSGICWDLIQGVNHTNGGNQSALHGWAMGNQDGWLVSPAITLPSSGPMVLAFWNINFDPDFYGYNSVLISTGSGNPADNQFTEVWNPDVPNSNWEQVTLNLAPYAGQTIYIGFRYTGDYAHDWIVDDVYIGDDFNTDPVIAVTPQQFNVNVPDTGPVTKKLSVKNIGVENLVYSISYSYVGTTEGWLSIDHTSGDISAGQTKVHQLVFDPTDMELGEYQAVITITSNDPSSSELTIPVNATIMEGANAEVIILLPDYTFPVDISLTGEYVAITGFGGGDAWLWSKTDGLKTIGGIEPSVEAVSEEGIVAGTSNNPGYIVNGSEVTMAGYWDPQTQQWTYLGINPAVGEPTSVDYNSTWGMTADGTTIVGMQYFADYQYKAFKWTIAGGYEMIGNLYSGGNRPNGISKDGSVVYGWADLPMASRSPVIWYNDQLIQIAPDSYGEAFAASFDGYYVAGTVDDKIFLWDKTGNTEIIENTFNNGSISPVAVGDDGTIFGFGSEGWPPFPDTRRAFVRTPDGDMMSFNEYLVGRGMVDAEDWLFFSVNGVTPDQMKFIGAGINPDNEFVTFYLDLAAEIPSIEVLPLSLEALLNSGEVTQQNLTIKNSGNGSLLFETAVHYFPQGTTTAITHVEEGAKKNPATIALQKTSSKGGQPATERAADTFILHYDKENADALGLTSGGTFYTAVRFPSEITAHLAQSTLTKVDVFVNNTPSDAKLMIWGPGTTTSPGSLLYEQAFNANENTWNIISLSETFAIDGTDLWIGLSYTHSAGAFVAGLDGGPANSNGGFISQDAIEWDRIYDFGFNSNWNIRANLLLGDGSWLSLNPDQGEVSGGETTDVTVTFTANVNPATYQANIIVESNDRHNPIQFVPVTLIVDGDPIITNLHEDFEGEIPPAGWNIYNIDGELSTWESNTTQNHTPGGTTSIAHTYGNPGIMQEGWLVTPKVALAADDDIYLSFWNYHAYPGYYGKNSVRISTGSGLPENGDFVEIWSPASVEIPWSETVLDLTSYAGQAIYIAFVYEGDDAHSWYLDDVSIVLPAQPASISLSPSSLSETLEPGQTSVQQLTVTNTGGSDLSFEIEVNIQDGANVLSPVSDPVNSDHQPSIHADAFAK
ncbi:MAG: choice-of-anchor J domain-containing protein, partial [Bacteroidales bacterium]|nr:choice-of-anchor J domain-containing protein [Bacteroidales bacterium]MDD3702440.1 choice-of-anchor J domain-containing protein [Bacteroidales bacterium]